MKIVVNKCFGGFSVSQTVMKELGISSKFGYLCNEDFGIENANWEAYRAAPALIAAIEKVGIKDATGSLAELEIVEIPDGTDWYIHDYDGIETIHEVHRSW